jgi:hypothetical protein
MKSAISFGWLLNDEDLPPPVKGPEDVVEDHSVDEYAYQAIDGSLEPDDEDRYSEDDQVDVEGETADLYAVTLPGATTICPCRPGSFPNAESSPPPSPFTAPARMATRRSSSRCGLGYTFEQFEKAVRRVTA